MRVENVADRRYAGSVIVSEARGRFFEPALRKRMATRTQLARRLRAADRRPALAKATGQPGWKATASG